MTTREKEKERKRVIKGVSSLNVDVKVIFKHVKLMTVHPLILLNQ